MKPEDTLQAAPLSNREAIAMALEVFRSGCLPPPRQRSQLARAFQAMALAMDLSADCEVAA